jgi:hypothetical protein
VFRTFLLSVAIVLCVCSKTPVNAASARSDAQTAPNAGAAQAPAPPAKPVPAQLPDVLARVNGESISKAEFDRAVASIEARAGGPMPPDQRDQILRTILDQIVGYKLLVQESHSRKVEASDTEVEARVQEIQKQFPDEGAFKQMLTARNRSRPSNRSSWPTTTPRIRTSSSSRIASMRVTSSSACRAAPTPRRKRRHEPRPNRC